MFTKTGNGEAEKYAGKSVREAKVPATAAHLSVS